jgi:hypothetical protein
LIVSFGNAKRLLAPVAAQAKRPTAHARRGEIKRWGLLFQGPDASGLRPGLPADAATGADMREMHGCLLIVALAAERLPRSVFTYGKNSV